MNPPQAGARLATTTRGLLLTLLALVAAAGCGSDGPRLYPITGEVTFDGEPIPDGYVTFFPEDARQTPAAGKIESGRYRLMATEGVKRVEVQASRFVGPENPIMGLRPREQFIPSRYNTESTLTATVSPDGDNEFDFALDSDASATPPEGDAAE